MIPKKSLIIRYSTAILLLAYSLFIINKSSQADIFYDITLRIALISLLFYFIIQLLFGIFQYFSLKKIFSVNLSFQDICIFPFLMGFWGYLVPIKGGMLFSIFYLKEKYQINYSEGISYGLLIQILSLFFSGIFLAIYAISLNILNVEIIFTSSLLISSPIVIIILSKILGMFAYDSKYKFVNFFVKTMVKISSTLREYVNNLYLSSIFLLFTVANIVLRGVWIFFIANELKYNYSFQVSLVISSILSLTQFLHFTPGGLGVSELLSSYIVSFFYIDMVQTLAILVIIRATSLLLIIPIGWIGTIHNLGNFSKENISKIYKGLS